MFIDEIKSSLLAIREVSEWPEMEAFIRSVEQPESMPCWEYTFVSCSAVGSDAAQAIPGAAAIFCMLRSIHLVDDMLDEEPGGAYRQLGAGVAANMALAYQAAALQVIDRANLDLEAREAVKGSLVEMALATAFGQNLDLSDVDNESSYWRIVEAKTPPLFSSALQIGAILGGVNGKVAQSLAKLGFQIGAIIQINDDLRDAFESPAAPDWRRRGNNLPILYAMTAEHDDRQRFLELLEEIEAPGALAEAQDILIRSGAASYCAYRIIGLYQEAVTALGRISLVNPMEARQLIDQHLEPLKEIFRTVGIKSVDALVSV